jgi:tRNA dimethylallyltransferase
LVGATPDPERRAQLEASDVDDLVALLRSRDPDAAERLDVRNRRRLIRAIEISDAGFAYHETRRQSPRYDTLKLGLTWPRGVLRRRIGERLRRRLDEGMVDEGRGLLRSGVTVERLDQLGLEYRYIARYLAGEYASEVAFVEDLERAIRRFARRQLAWFRRDPDIIWLHSEGGDYMAEADRLVEEFVVER